MVGAVVVSMLWLELFCCQIFLRFSCVPVDFEVVNVNSSQDAEEDINNAITAIRRNGVALKGMIIGNELTPYLKCLHQ